MEALAVALALAFGSPTPQQMKLYSFVVTISKKKAEKLWNGMILKEFS